MIHYIVLDKIDLEYIGWFDSEKENRLEEFKKFCEMANLNQSAVTFYQENWMDELKEKEKMDEDKLKKENNICDHILY